MPLRLLTFLFIILFACSGGKTVKHYELQKDLFYDLEGGDGVGLVSDLDMKTNTILTKGTKISVTSQIVKSSISGSETLVEVKILDGKYKGNEIYIGSLQNRQESLKLITQ